MSTLLAGCKAMLHQQLENTSLKEQIGVLMPDRKMGG
jgi:hypothetical protein